MLILGLIFWTVAPLLLNNNLTGGLTVSAGFEAAWVDAGVDVALLKIKTGFGFFASSSNNPSANMLILRGNIWGP